ncbi:Zonadhesin [Sciurus carolinensis]|uniref:Erythropoietin n=1 Tax=Sciurus carolinensis TaxID=30640 RepID=A0AA41T614_SCICA|nr:Zonadhesin [Sciurus carolinensis]
MGARECPVLPLLLSLLFLPLGLPVLGTPARLICDSRVLERYILEAKEAENVTMGCADGCSLHENVTVPDTKVNFYAWRRMEVGQQAIEVWQGLALLSEAILRGQALLANSSQPSDTLQLHVDKAVSGLRSLTSLLRALGIQCDFEDSSKPLCDWSQEFTDDGDWTRANGPSPSGTTGPPGGYPNGEGYYLHMDSNNFRQGGVARLRSPDLWEPGPFCVRFAYHMFGLSWGSWLRLLLFMGKQSNRPKLLWKHTNTQSPSWIPTSVAVPAGLNLPSWLTFEGMRGNTPYLDISLDALAIHRGTCNRICMMQMCSFDTINDLCGWSWIPSSSGAKWTQKKGSSGKQDVGPKDDFSNPGSGFYMLLDPKNAKPGQKSSLLSPPSRSTGCLTLSFYYILRNRSPGAALLVYASVLGSIRKHTLFSGQPGPNWQPISVNYTGPGQIQFAVVGVFGKIPEPAIAVDAVSLAPCGDSFPQCDFEDRAHPFCDWTHTPETGGHWSWGSKTILSNVKGLVGESSYQGDHFVYFEADKLSKPGQSVRLMSRPFCAPGDVCVVFSYHMAGTGEGSTLILLLGSPAGSSPVSLWNRVGAQSPNWLNASVTISSGRRQPMQLIFEAVRGSNPAFIVAVGFIAINQGSCPVKCAPGAHYESCACPASCKNPKPNCDVLCQPGCICNPGFLFSNDTCINASSCDCFYGNSFYKVGQEWFSPNCTERCRCHPGSRLECQISECGSQTVCQMKDGKYGCHPYGTSTCMVYGDPHYITFDERHIYFSGKCTYVLTQPCRNSSNTFFKVLAKNEEWGPKGLTCLSKVQVILSETTITLLKGRQTLVKGRRVTLPVMPSKGVVVRPSGRFVKLKTSFGLRVKWDGHQQLFVTMTSMYSGQLCGFCGNYDGDSSNDNLKPDGRPARDDEELGNSWQTDKECQKIEKRPSTCDRDLRNTVSGSKFCGQLSSSHGVFEECQLHMKISSFFDNCLYDMCNFQGFQLMLCIHLSFMTAACQHAGYPVKPWRRPQFCPLVCPANSTYSLCANACPNTCHSKLTDKTCPDHCVEACECNQGFVLSGLECVPPSQCGCLDDSGTYFKVSSWGEQWYKPGCKEFCICENNRRIHCQPWNCKAQEACVLQDGTYGCHAQGAATCSASGDPHYLTFDGALHHFMGTCAYVLVRPCTVSSRENNFAVSTTNEIRDGNLELSFVKAVNVQIFNLKISLIKGRRVVVNGYRMSLPMWPLAGQVIIRLSGSFILLYTAFGLQVRYDGNHLVEVTVPSSYAGQLCGLCGNYNNNSLDDNLRPDRRPIGNSIYLGASWKSAEDSEPGCYLRGGMSSSCQYDSMSDTWNRTCAILVDPQGPFSPCHRAVPPQASFSSCVYGQCGTKGGTVALCHSLQTYASLCALTGHAVAWRNSSFCPLRCPSGSHYNYCTSPCPANCLSLKIPMKCPPLPCVEGCECHGDNILSGTSCVPLSQCGCTDPKGFYHPVGESWYTENTCTTRCTCSVQNNITCQRTSCKTGETCRALYGLFKCRVADVGVCQVSGGSQFVSFDGTGHQPIVDTCTRVFVKVCHPDMNLPFFKISAKSNNPQDSARPVSLPELYINIFNSKVVLKKNHRVLVSWAHHPPLQINDAPATLPATSQIPGLRITASGTYTVVSVDNGAQIRFDGNQSLEIKLPIVYYDKVCGVCGNFNGEEDDELLTPSEDLVHNNQEFMDSWKDKGLDPNCQQVSEETQSREETQAPVESQDRENKGRVKVRCKLVDAETARGNCQAALQAPAWSRCASHVDVQPFLLVCRNKFCDSGSLTGALCQAFQAYGDACQNQGLKPPIWRNSSFCPMECPAHSSYSNCLPTCPTSCSNPEGRCKNGRRPSTCAEGCLCRSGYVMNGNKCVSKSSCGCKDAQGGTIPMGKTWISTGCTQACSCTGGSIQCKAFRCPAQSHCQHKEGTNNCAPDTMTCPANTVYQSCMMPCLLSCANLEALGDCKGPCVEGCANLPGYAYSGAQSLPVADCGCTTDGVYHQLGDSFVTEDCSQRCTCASSGVLRCEPFGCSAEETCTLGNFTRGCFRGEPGPLSPPCCSPP